MMTSSPFSFLSALSFLRSNSAFCCLLVRSALTPTLSNVEFLSFLDLFRMNVFISLSGKVSLMGLGFGVLVGSCDLFLCPSLVMLS